MATNFWLPIGYSFGCVIASDTVFDSKGGFSESSYAMETQPRLSVNFGTKFDNYGCMTASDSLFDSMDRFSRSSYSMKTAEIEGLRDVAMATNFGTKIAKTGFA